MTKIIVQRTVEGITLTATYHGGPYIDVARKGRTASEVINVWDYQRSCSEINCTREDVGATFDRWIETYSEDEPSNSRKALAHDVRNHW